MAGTSAIYPGCAAVVSRTQLPRNSVLVMASIPAFPHKQIPNGYSTSGGGGCRATSRDNLYEDGDGELEREEFGEVGVG